VGSHHQISQWASSSSSGHRKSIQWASSINSPMGVQQRKATVTSFQQTTLSSFDISKFTSGRSQYFVSGQSKFANGRHQNFVSKQRMLIEIKG